MTNLSRAPLRPLLNLPVPEGARPTAAYSRIIPAEELGEVNAWQPAALVDATPRPLHPLRSDASGTDTAADEPAPIDLDQVLAEARKAAYEEGYRDGLKALEAFKQSHADEVAAQSSARLAQWLSQLDTQWEDMEPRLAQSVAQTAVRLARQVLRQELQTRPEQVLGLAREAVQALSANARRLELLVHPDDLPLVQQGLGELLQARGGRVHADDSMARGGCRVHADIASVDATLERRWADAARALGSDLPFQDDTPAAS